MFLLRIKRMSVENKGKSWSPFHNKTHVFITQHIIIIIIIIIISYDTNC